MSYQLTSDTRTILRKEDGAYIPNDPGNRDYIEYQAWLAKGNTPDPYVAPAPPPPPTPAQKLAALGFTPGELKALLATAP